MDDQQIDGEYSGWGLFLAAVVLPVVLLLLLSRL